MMCIVFEVERMIKIAVVEDDKNYSELLKKYILRYEEESGEKFQISVFEDGEDIVTNYKGNYDIILTDIEMRFLNGMKAAEKIREMDSEVVIIFITNMPQYAIHGYAVDALDFVLKPINYYAFSQRIDRALVRMRKREKTYISIAYRGGAMKIDADTICFVESQDHNLIFHTTEGEFITRSTLKEIEERLDKIKFFRCSICYLINLEYVNGYHNNDVHVADHTLQVSRGRKKGFMDALNNYMNEVSK
jgi:DNA-binding LytR/AlgR family response regulator